MCCSRTGNTQQNVTGRNIPEHNLECVRNSTGSKSIPRYLPIRQFCYGLPRLNAHLATSAPGQLHVSSGFGTLSHGGHGELSEQ